MPTPLTKGYYTSDVNHKTDLPGTQNTALDFYQVTHDTVSNNGFYYWNGSAYTKFNFNGAPTPHDPI